LIIAARDPLTPAEKQARVVDLLRARSGVYHDVDFETSYMKVHRPRAEATLPARYGITTTGITTCSAPSSREKTGLKIGDAFYRRIAQPLGMEDFQPADLFYFGGPLSNYPAYHFESSARDMARFGLLYLLHGRWNDRQIVHAWVEKSTHGIEMLKDEHFGEGDCEYLWWVEYGDGLLYDGALPGEFFAMGANGHFILVIPNARSGYCQSHGQRPARPGRQDQLRVGQQGSAWAEGVGPSGQADPRARTGQ
jgi:CubicO group peptidase (beta-lactamase class C family)